MRPSTIENKIANSPLLDPEDKAWLKAGGELFLECPADDYAKDLEDTMNALIYLNGQNDAASLPGSQISVWYYTLRTLRDKFTTMHKVGQK